MATERQAAEAARWQAHLAAEAARIAAVKAKVVDGWVATWQAGGKAAREAVAEAAYCVARGGHTMESFPAAMQQEMEADVASFRSSPGPDFGGWDTLSERGD